MAMMSSLRSTKTTTTGFSLLLRSMSTTSHHKEHVSTHEYLSSTKYIGSWGDAAPRDPKEAERKLASLRRDYAKQFKEIRKQYISEMEMQRVDKLRKDEARRQEILRQREERNKFKAAAAEARAAERKASEEEFRQTLMKERAEKLEYWRMRQNTIEEKKKSKKEDIVKQSSEWIGEEELEAKLMESTVDQLQL